MEDFKCLTFIIFYNVQSEVNISMLVMTNKFN